MMTINEVSLNRPKILVDFFVIFCFFRLKLFPIAVRFSARTVCNTSNHEMNSKRRKTRNDTQAVAGKNSRIQISGILGFGATQRRSQGNQEMTSRPGKQGKNKHPKRKLAGTVAHQSILFPNQIFLLWYEEFVLNIFILCRKTRHIVLDHRCKKMRNKCK